jgi:hypothetical protein
MVYIKRFESIEREELDSYLLDHFLDLDEKYDVDINCNNGKMSIQFEQRYDPQSILEDVWNRVVRIRSLGEFTTNNIWSEIGHVRYGSIGYMANIPNLRHQLYTGEIFVGDSEISDFSVFVDSLSRYIRSQNYKGRVINGQVISYNISKNRSDTELKDIVTDSIQKSLKISSISLEFKPSK